MHPTPGVGFPGPEGRRLKKMNAQCGLSGARRPPLTRSTMAPIPRTKKKTFHITPRCNKCNVNHCTLATPPQPQWHYSHQRQTTHPIMLYKRLLNPGMHYQVCQHPQTALNIKSVSQRRPRGGSDTRVTTALPQLREGLSLNMLEPKGV